MRVACDVDKSASSNDGVWMVVLGATTTRLPEMRGKRSSRLEMSKLMVVAASRQSSALRKSPARIANMKFDRFESVMTTPFGLPVEPEV
jgi:hypothetical protein